MPEVLSPPQELTKRENAQNSPSELPTDTLVQELFPGAVEVNYKPDEERSYPVASRAMSRVETMYAHILPVVAEELNKADSSDKLLVQLKEVEGLFLGNWHGREVVDQCGGFYDDSPVESDAYCYLMNGAYLPTLIKLESVLANSDAQECAKTVKRLEDYVSENYKYSSWDFIWASEIAVSMLNINGINSFPAIKRVSEYITEEPNDGAFEFDPNDYYDPIYLEFDDPEYRGFHAAIVEAISEYPWDDGEKIEAARFLSGYLAINSEGNLRTYVAAFEDLGVDNALPHLLSNLRSEDVLTRRMSAEILFRLELGKVGVSEDGVEYLGKLYDLGKYNDPDFFVRRLSSSGLMAVLGEGDGNIEGVFPLDLYSGEDVIQAEVRQLMSQELFLPKADETPEQRKQRESYLKLFLENYESIFNDKFFKDTGVRLNTLELHEQGWFLLNYLELTEKGKTEELERLKKFVSTYGEYGLKSFLALEYGGSGQEILDFAESAELTKEEKLAIFKNFYGIANEAFGWRKVFGQVETEVGLGFAPQVHEAFVRKNAEFFRAAQLIAKGEGGEVTIRELLQNMNTIAFSLRALKGIYDADSTLLLQQAPQTQDEYAKDGNLVASASSSYILVDEGIGARVVVSIRPQPTVKQGNISGGEARINFSVTNTTTEERARIGFDLSSPLGGSSAMSSDDLQISLDLGVGKYDPNNHPTSKITDVLSMIENTEGGHNFLSFRPEVAEQFPEIAKRFRDYVEAKFVGQK